jgi:hypothetical protein
MFTERLYAKDQEGGRSILHCPEYGECEHSGVGYLGVPIYTSKNITKTKRRMIFFKKIIPDTRIYYVKIGNNAALIVHPAVFEAAIKPLLNQ